MGYDSYGRRSAMTDSVGSHSYTYDDDDDLLTETTTYTGLPAKTLTYGYFPDGSRQNMAISGLAGSFGYSYDGAGRMTGLTNPYGENASWSYKNNDWLATAQNTAASASLGYDLAGRMTSLNNTSGAGGNSTFSTANFDGVGNRLNLTANIPAVPSYNGTTNYTYDYGQTGGPAANRSQLTQETSTRNGGYGKRLRLRYRRQPHRYARPRRSLQCRQSGHDARPQ